jgi:hypothetical protein
MNVLEDVKLGALQFDKFNEDPSGREEVISLGARMW